MVTMPLADLAPDQRAVLKAVVASLSEGHLDVSVHEVAAGFSGSEALAATELESLERIGLLERVSDDPLYAGLDLPPLYSIGGRFEQELGPDLAGARPILSKLDDFHSFEPVESFAYPAWVQELGL